MFFDYHAAKATVTVGRCFNLQHIVQTRRLRLIQHIIFSRPSLCYSTHVDNSFASAHCRSNSVNRKFKHSNRSGLAKVIFSPETILLTCMITVAFDWYSNALCNCSKYCSGTCVMTNFHFDGRVLLQPACRHQHLTPIGPSSTWDLTTILRKLRPYSSRASI
jgi:hypothetical protein